MRPSTEFSEKPKSRSSVTIVSYYTDRPGYAVAGIESFTFQSEKRRAELLNLRSAFIECFVQEWVKQRGRREEAIFQIRNYWGRCDGPTR